MGLFDIKIPSSTKDIFNADNTLVGGVVNDISNADNSIADFASDPTRIALGLSTLGLSEVVNTSSTGTGGKDYLNGGTVVPSNNTSIDVPTLDIGTVLGKGGIGLGSGGEQFKEKKRKSIAKKRLGASSLRIPLTSNNQTTTSAGVSANASPSKGIKI